MGEENRQPPSWMYRESRPPSDSAYFENMVRTIFQAGLSWKTIDNKWANFQKAFANFSIDKVANFKEKDVKRLMNDKSIIRNQKKIEATIINANEFKKIIKSFGSFQTYLDGFNKSENYTLIIKELSNRFQRVGPSTARIFLYSIGEQINHSD